MNGMNKVILIGTLDADPEVSTTQSQRKVARLFLVTSENATVHGLQSRTNQWHRVVLYNNLAELADHFLTKGRQIMVEGSLRYSDWIDFSGDKKFSAEIHADKLLMLGGRSELAQTEEPRVVVEPMEVSPSPEIRQSA